MLCAWATPVPQGKPGGPGKVSVRDTGSASSTCLSPGPDPSKVSWVGGGVSLAQTEWLTASHGTLVHGCLLLPFL